MASMDETISCDTNINTPIVWWIFENVLLTLYGKITSSIDSGNKINNKVDINLSLKILLFLISPINNKELDPTNPII